MERTKQVLEPAGAAALAAVLAGSVPLRDGDRVAVILSGGNVATDRLGRAPRGRRAIPHPRVMEQPEGDAFGPLVPPPVPAGVPQPPLPPPVPVTAPYAAYPGYYGYVAPRPVLPPVSEAILRIPLGTRELIRQALDLLTRSDSGLRGPSFYIGFMLLVTFGPLAVILGMVLAVGQDLAATPGRYGAPPPSWVGWMFLAFIPALAGLIAASAEASGLATAVIGGRVRAARSGSANRSRSRAAGSGRSSGHAC